MHTSIRLIPSLALAFTLVSLANAADDDPIKQAVETAKERYDGDLTRYRLAIQEHFEKQEETARSGGNKKLVDQVKADRKAFEDNGKVPLNLPAATKKKLESGRAAMDAAYAAAIKDYTKVKKDNEATAMTKELDRFRKKVADESNKERVELYESAPAKYLAGKKFTFGEGTKVFATFTFKANGEISGNKHPNESGWMVNKNNRLVLTDPNDKATSIYTSVAASEGQLILKGDFLFSPKDNRRVFELKEVVKP